MAWWKLGVVKIESGKLWVRDAQFVADREPFLVIEVPPGDYEVRTREPFVRGGAREMRACRVGSKFKRGEKLGETWADTASHGVCDDAVAARYQEEQGEAFGEGFEDLYDKGKAGFFAFDWDGVHGVAWTFIEGGDGDYPVYELLDPNGERCGIEVDFQAEEE